jgi:site-specific DNA recombinase
MATKAVIYCRVSTEEQAERYSLAAQEKDCRRFAEREGSDVSEVFIERGKSAKDIEGRPELQRLIAYVIAKKIDWVIIYRLDRLSRDMLKTLELYRDLSKANIRIMSVTENNDESPAGNLQRNITACMAQYEREVLSVRVTRGMMESVTQGRWVFPPPIGYKYTIDKYKKKLLIPTDGAKFVLRSYELAATGQYSMQEIWEKLSLLPDRTTSPKTLEYMLHNPLYAGYLNTPWFADYLPGIHEPIISKELFWKVQKVYEEMKTANKQPRKENPDFPLKNILICQYCGRHLTGNWSKGRAKKYPYYRCPDPNHNGCRININRDILHKSFIDILSRLQLDKYAVEIFNKTLLAYWKKCNKRRELIITTNEKKIIKLEDDKQKLIDLLLDDTIDKDTYKIKRIDIESNIMATKIHLGETACDQKEFESRLVWANNFLSNQAELWLKADYNGKILIQATMFPKGIYIDRDGTVRTAATLPIFNVLDNLIVNEKKNGGA